jgi:hypothetical protein
MKKILGALTAVAIGAGSLAVGAGTASAMTTYYPHHHYACHAGYHPVKVYRHGKWVWVCYRNHHHHYYTMTKTPMGGAPKPHTTGGGGGMKY